MERRIPNNKKIVHEAKQKRCSSQASPTCIPSSHSTNDLGKEPETGAEDGSDGGSTRADLESVGTVTGTARARAGAGAGTRATGGRGRGGSSSGVGTVAGRSSSSVLSSVEEHGIDDVDNTVLGDVVASNDLGGHVAERDEGTRRVGGEHELVTGRVDGVLDAGKLGRVNDGTVDDVVEQNGGALLLGGSLDGGLDPLDGLVGGGEHGDDRVVQRLDEVGVVEKLGERRSTELASDTGDVGGNREDTLNRLNTDVLVLRAILSVDERDVARSQLDVGSVVVRVLGENGDLAAVAGKHDKLARVESGANDGLVVGTNLAGGDRAVEDCGFTNQRVMRRQKSSSQYTARNTVVQDKWAGLVPVSVQGSS